MTGPLAFSPYDYAIHDDPYPTYARLRDEAPLYHNPEVGFWALSRYADVVDAFRDSARYSSAYGVSLDPSAYGPDAHRYASFLAMDQAVTESVAGVGQAVGLGSGLDDICPIGDAVEVLGGLHRVRICRFAAT